MGIPFFRRSAAVNIVINDQEIQLVESADRSPLQALAWHERQLPAGIVSSGQIIHHDALILILKEWMEDLKLKNKKVRFIVPDEYIIIRQLEVDSDILPDELHNHLFLEIGESIHLPFENPVFDAVSLGQFSSLGKQKVLFVASKEEIVDSYEDALKKAGLVPVTADISPLALYRLYDALHSPGDNEHVMIIHLNEMLVTLSIFYNHCPLFIRPVDLRVAEMTEAEVDPYLEGLRLNIENVLNFYKFTMNQGEGEVEAILLSGDHPLYGRIKEYLFILFEERIKEIVETPLYDAEGKEIPRKFQTAIGLGL